MNPRLPSRCSSSRFATLLVLLFSLLVLPACAQSTPPSTAVPPTGARLLTQVPVATSIPPVQPPAATPTLEPTALPASPTPPPTIAVTPAATITPTPPGFDLAPLQEVMLTAINADRAAAGLDPVAWDDTAAQAGQTHTADMLANDYFSHWNLQGLGPEHRYAQADGRDAAAENLYTYWYRYEDGRAAPIEDWPRVIRDAQASLMQSPGHRRTILQPSHTHVGIGIAYDPQRGEMRLAQEFVTRLVDMEALPAEVAPGDTLVVRGTLSDPATDPLINLAYMPWPTPFTADTVPQGTYTSPAEIIEAIQPQLDDRQFSANVRLGQSNAPGIYTIRVWVRQGEEMVLSNELIVFAR